MNITKLAIFKKIKTKGGGGATVLEGDGQEYHSLAPTALSFRSTEPLEEFMEVQVNGETVDPENYTLEEGSTIVTLKPEYLKTLGGGNYEISIVSQNKTTSGKFDVTVPDLNEYGFYYNQPYTAYVAMFGENESFFIRDDGTMDIIGTPSGEISLATYSVSGDTMTVVSNVAGTLTGTISADGTEIFCNELQTAFKLGNTSIIADEDYVYIYKEDLGGYEVNVIDKTKAEYGAIKTGIHGINTVALINYLFHSNDNLVNAPIIPDSVETIGAHAFTNCSTLKNVIFADGSRLKTIKIYAFSDCVSLESISLPASVTTIEWGVFADCTSLASIVFEGTVEQWNAITFERVDGALDWNQNVPATYVQCSDGQVSLV